MKLTKNSGQIPQFARLTVFTALFLCLFTVQCKDSQFDAMSEHSNSTEFNTQNELSSDSDEISGRASGVQGTIADSSVRIADTGTLTGTDDARGAALVTSDIASLGSVEVLHATTISSIDGWNPEDFVASEASLSALDLSVGGNAISADFAMARALSPVEGTPVGASSIDGLSVNGEPVTVTGETNQTVPLIGGQLVINEQQTTASGEKVVNALRIVVDGVANVAIASATSGVNSSSDTTNL